MEIAPQTPPTVEGGLVFFEGRERVAAMFKTNGKVEYYKLDQMSFEEIAHLHGSDKVQLQEGKELGN